MNKTRAAIIGTLVGVTAVSAAFGGWAIVDWIRSAPLLDQFLLAVGGVTAPATAAYVSYKKS